MSNNGLSNSMTVVGLVNGMIGGIILVMPILSIKTGFALIAPIAILSGLFSYFSSSLCLRHLRNYADLDQAVLRHFGGKRGYKIFYDATICVSMTVLLILYFGLIC
jgi:amino acid permease